MGDNTIKLLNEAIKLENNVAELYQLFSLSFDEDKNFWWQIVIEEKNHAALLRSGKESYIPANIFPKKILPKTIDDMAVVNNNIRDMIINYKKNKPSRTLAFNIAYHLENSAGEIHYQQFMEKEPETKIENIFIQLNQEDKDHAQRIEDYMKEHQIKKTKENLPEFLT